MEDMDRWARGANKMFWGGSNSWSVGVETKQFMKQLLRFHQKLTPETTIILVDWMRQVRSIPDWMYRNYYGWASDYAVRLDMLEFLKEFQNDTRFHCVGFSMGAHACAAMCRQLYHHLNKSCERIVGLDPVNLLAKETRDNFYELDRNDAKYVSVIASSYGAGPARPIGDDFILSDLGSGFHEACPKHGGWWGTVCATSFLGERVCEYFHIKWNEWWGFAHLSRVRCSHIAVLFTFMKSLDASRPLALINPFGQMYLSSWSGYSISRDYDSTSFNSSHPVSSLLRLNTNDMRSAAIIIIATQYREGYLWNSEPFYTRRIFDDYILRFYLSFEADGKTSMQVYTKYGARMKFVRVYHPIASSLNPHFPMTGFSAVDTICFDKYTYWPSGDKKWTCHFSMPQYIFAYRNQFNVTPSVFNASSMTVVPPKANTCLPYKVSHAHHPTLALGDVFTQRKKWIDLSYVVSKYNYGFQLYAIKVANHTISTFWNSCNLTDIGFRGNRTTRAVALRFMKIGFYPVEFDFDLFRLIVHVSVVDLNSTQRRFKREVIKENLPDKLNKGPVYVSAIEKQAPVILFWWDNEAGKYETFAGTPSVYSTMESRGVFANGRDRDIVLLVHGWHAHQSSESMFLQMLRFHQKLTPRTAILYVKWESQGANYIELGNAAFAATRINLDSFLRNINPMKTRLHCVGHSLGGHACGAICRMFKLFNPNHQCERIVSLDPASVMFKHDSPYPDVVQKRISRYDAKYVAVLMTNRNFMGLADVVGDEYITVNGEGWHSEGCPLIGKWWGRICATGYYGNTECEDMDVKTMFNSGIIPHIKDTCSHMMAPIHFMRLLDVNVSAPIIRYGRHPDYPASFLSSWNSYVTSRDYRYGTYFQEQTIWYASMFDATSLTPLDLVHVVLGSHGDTEVLHCVRKERFLDGNYAHVFCHVPEKFYVTRRGVFLKPTSHVYYVHVFKGQGYGINPSAWRPGVKITPMTYLGEKRMRCHYYEFLDYTERCIDSIREARWTPQYRTQLNVTDEATLIPPERGCLPYNADWWDLIQPVYRKMYVHQNEWVNISIPADNEHLFQLVYSENGLKDITLSTFWDECVEAQKANISFILVPNSRILSIKFLTVGMHHLFALYETRKHHFIFDVDTDPLFIFDSDSPSNVSYSTPNITNTSTAAATTTTTTTTTTTITTAVVTIAEVASPESKDSPSKSLMVGEVHVDNANGASGMENPSVEPVHSSGPSAGLIVGIVIVVALLFLLIAFAVFRKVTRVPSFTPLPTSLTFNVVANREPMLGEDSV